MSSVCAVSVEGAGAVGLAVNAEVGDSDGGASASTAVIINLECGTVGEDEVGFTAEGEAI